MYYTVHSISYKQKEPSDLDNMICCMFKTMKEYQLHDFQFNYTMHIYITEA